MFSFLVLSRKVLPHIHFNILTLLLYCFLVVQHCMLYNMACLIALQYNLPFNFVGILWSHYTPQRILHLTCPEGVQLSNYLKTDMSVVQFVDVRL